LHVELQQNQARRFHKRTINLAVVQFYDEELHLLNKGLKYVLPNKYINLITSLVLKANTAISLLPDTEQSDLRHIVIRYIKKLIKQSTLDKTHIP
jgi:hypothetical protein